MHQSINRFFALWLFLLPALAACGGGGGGGASSGGDNRIANLPFPVWLVDPAVARGIVPGSQAPTLMNREAEQVLDAIESAADTLLLSDLVRISGPSPLPDRVPIACAGATCTSTLDGRTVMVSLGDPDTSDRSVFRVVMLHNGVHLGQSFSRNNTGQRNQSDAFLYGGWLEHSAFLVEVLFIPGANAVAETRDIFAGSGSYGSSLPGTNPVAVAGRTATWEGVMLGVGYGALNAELVYQGDATVAVDFNRVVVNVNFSNINDLNNRDRLGDMAWSDLPISNGAFSSGSGGDRLEGRFYGPNHEEVGGIFDRGDVVGAFGAGRGTP